MTNSTTPNTAANGGQILTDERIAEIADATGMMAKNDVLSGLDGGLFCIDFARAIEADLRTLAAVPASEPVRLMNFGVDGPAQWSGANNACDLTKYVEITYSNSVQIAAAPAPVSGMPDLASLQRWEFETYDQGGNWMEPNITGEYVRFADVERLLSPDAPNPTGETK